MQRNERRERKQQTGNAIENGRTKRSGGGDRNPGTVERSTFRRTNETRRWRNVSRKVQNQNERTPERKNREQNERETNEWTERTRQNATNALNVPTTNAGTNQTMNVERNERTKEKENERNRENERTRNETRRTCRRTNRTRFQRTWQNGTKNGNQQNGRNEPATETNEIKRTERCSGIFQNGRT